MKNEELTMERTNSFVLKYNFVREGGAVRRYHTRHLNKPETVAAHSWGVACMVDMLYAGVSPAGVLRAALYHDIAEQSFGDIPSPAKRALNSAELKSAEDQAMRAHGLFTELSKWERYVLKLADLLDGMAFCTEERERGNVGILDIYNRYHQYMREHITQMAENAEEMVSAETFSVVAEQAAKIIGCITGKMEAIHASR